MEVLEKAKELESRGIDVIHFEIGEPDTPTNIQICEAAIDSIRAGNTRYSESMGIPILKNAIAEEYKKSYGVEISERRVGITMGSSPAIFLTLLSIIEPGDEVIVIEPHYPCYPQLIRISGGIPVSCRVYEEDEYQIDIDRLRKKISNRTRGIIVNSPSNPTGTIMEPDILKSITELGIYVISDEIYHGLEYGKKAHSILEYTDNAFVLNGFSKLYSMTGWRLGYCILPEEFIRPVQKLQQNLFISPNPFVQMAGVEAIKKVRHQVPDLVDLYNSRRLIMLEGLREMGFDLKTVPNGAFYVFLDISPLGRKSYDLAFDILEKVHLAVTPGIDFGVDMDGYMRLTYTNPEEVIREGLGRLAKYLELQTD